MPEYTMQKAISLLLVLLLTINVKPQSKIIKEVSEDVQSEVKVIIRDNVLVGYLVFTQLEKISKDSFNYRISLLDENLNDIVRLNFPEEYIHLEQVASEQDIICLTYIKKIKDGYNSKENNILLVQFLSLEGNPSATALKKIPLPQNNKFKEDNSYDHELKNIQGVGFACFYGNKSERKIVLYNLNGELQWEKELLSGQLFEMLATTDYLFILEITSGFKGQANFFVNCYSVKDGMQNYRLAMQDSLGQELKVLSWGLDHLSGKPYAAGIISSQNGPDKGIFSFVFDGSSRNNSTKQFVYWGKISQPYIKLKNSFKDFDGNTYFIISTSLSDNFRLLKMDKTDNISFTEIAGINKERDFYLFENPSGKENYAITNDKKDVLVYNFKKGGIIRSIPVKEGKSRIKVYPAKEGHILISETNKKEKLINLMIEPLY